MYRAVRILKGVCLLCANMRRQVPREYLNYSVHNLLRAHRLASAIADGEAVLDIGCGSGHTLHDLSLFRSVRAFGVDLAAERLAHPIPFVVYDGAALPFVDKAFDVTLICYVLHHITEAQARTLIQEAVRVTRREIQLMEDSLPRFGVFYRLRNMLHLLEGKLVYESESRAYRTPAGQKMFMTYEEWDGFLTAIPGVSHVSIESLAPITRFAHHTLIRVDTRPSARCVPPA
jgi:SAM-dependent methyltransferase